MLGLYVKTGSSGAHLDWRLPFLDSRYGSCISTNHNQTGFQENFPIRAFAKKSRIELTTVKRDESRAAGRGVHAASTKGKSSGRRLIQRPAGDCGPYLFGEPR